jgi:hypothetical protein
MDVFFDVPLRRIPRETEREGETARHSEGSKIGHLALAKSGRVQSPAQIRHLAYYSGCKPRRTKLPSSPIFSSLPLLLSVVIIRVVTYYQKQSRRVRQSATSLCCCCCCRPGFDANRLNQARTLDVPQTPKGSQKGNKSLAVHLTTRQQQHLNVKYIHLS